jgi:hypothetical protein
MESLWHAFDLWSQCSDTLTEHSPCMEYKVQHGVGHPRSRTRHRLRPTESRSGRRPDRLSYGIDSKGRDAGVKRIAEIADDMRRRVHPCHWYLTGGKEC